MCLSGVVCFTFNCFAFYPMNINTTPSAGAKNMYSIKCRLFQRIPYNFSKCVICFNLIIC